jgi:hypothetical protein
VKTNAARIVCCLAGARQQLQTVKKLKLEIYNVHGILGYSRKHSYHPHRGNWKLIPSPFGCPNTFTIIRNNFLSPPPPEGRNFLRGGVWIFSGTTH